jgi:hypothetical protein
MTADNPAYISPSFLGGTFNTSTKGVNGATVTTTMKVDDMAKKLGNVVDAGTNQNDRFSKFNRFRVIEGEDYSIGGISYVFFTKPQLNLTGGSFQNVNYTADKLKYDSFLYNLKTGTLGNLGTKILNSLDRKSGLAQGSHLMPLITNSAKSFETKDTTIKTDEYYDNYLGNKIVVPGGTNESDTADTFTIDYTEYADLSLTLLHKVWVDYMHLVRRGMIDPHPDFAQLGIIDYVSSVYYFKLGDDGKKIKFWSKYTGVFPVNIPYSAFSYHHADPKVKELSVQYAYSFKEDMSYDVLYDFLQITGGAVSNDLYEKNFHGKVHTLADTWNGEVKLNSDLTKLLFL